MSKDIAVSMSAVRRAMKEAKGNVVSDGDLEQLLAELLTDVKDEDAVASELTGDSIKRISHVSTFAERALLTHEKGLVITLASGAEFQLGIQKSANEAHAYQGDEYEDEQEFLGDHCALCMTDMRDYEDDDYDLVKAVNLTYPIIVCKECMHKLDTEELREQGKVS